MLPASGDAAARRILLLAETFAPGAAAEELALWLAGRAHAVEVVAAEGTRAGDEKGWWRVEERHGIRVARCPRRRAHLPRGLGRQLQHASFALSSAPVLLGRARRFHPHLIGAIDPPAACLPALLLAARQRRARSWVHLSDASLLDGNSLGRVDHVSLAAVAAGERLAEAGIPEPRRLPLLPWVDTRRIHPLEPAGELRRQLAPDPDAIVALYVGSLEERQGIDRLLAAAARLPANGAVLFVLAGRGGAWARAVAATERLPLCVLPWPRAANLNALLAIADIHLLPAGAAEMDPLLPGKLAALLASGRPVIAAGIVPAILAKAIKGAPSDADALARAIIALAASPAERRRRGTAARQAAQEYLEKERVFRQLEEGLGLRGPAPSVAAD
jgi:colanic acid biosynthesis glycosyl transferase WcaI